MSKVDTKTFGSTDRKDPLNALRGESIDRMKASLLSAPLDDPRSAANAIKTVTLLRASHQVTRIVQYLELMDKLEEKLYESISYDIDNCDAYDGSTIVRLLSVQEKMQRMIVESNKLLAPYLEMSQYEAFNEIALPEAEDNKVLEISASQRHLLRENASSILKDLEDLDTVESA